MEKARKLSAVQAKKNEYGDSSKYVSFVSVDKTGKMTDGLVAAQLNLAKIDEDIRFAGYNLLVTSEIKMSDRDIYAAYHNLWRNQERPWRSCRGVAERFALIHWPRLRSAGGSNFDAGM